LTTLYDAIENVARQRGCMIASATLEREREREREREGKRDRDRETERETERQRKVRWRNSYQQEELAVQ
jgi:hypothetical protein